MEEREPTFDDVMLSHMPYYVYAALDTEKIGVKTYSFLCAAFRHREDAELFIQAATEKRKGDRLETIYKIVDYTPKEDEV